jgi:chaperonin cofactor prefoldin
MNTPQKKEKMEKLKKRVRVAEHSVARLQEKVKTLTQEVYSSTRVCIQI